MCCWIMNMDRAYLPTFRYSSRLRKSKICTFEGKLARFARNIRGSALVRNFDFNSLTKCFNRAKSASTFSPCSAANPGHRVQPVRLQKWFDGSIDAAFNWVGCMRWLTRKQDRKKLTIHFDLVLNDFHVYDTLRLGALSYRRLSMGLNMLNSIHHYIL